MSSLEYYGNHAPHASGLDVLLSLLLISVATGGAALTGWLAATALH
jgi:hypothetical protein